MSSPHPLRPDQVATVLAPLWDHQARAFDAGRTVVAQGARAPLFQCPTGGGKTRLGLEFVLRHIARDPANRVLWFAHRDELVEQPLAKLRAVGAPAGLLGDGQPITVLGIQTAVARSVAPPCTLAVFDEARHYVAPQWGAIASRYVEAGTLRIGLDATPAGAGGASLRPLFDVLVPVASIGELIAAGVLVRSVVYAADEFTDHLTDTALGGYQRHTPGEQAIVFSPSVAEAEETAAEFNRAGIVAACVEGNTARVTRRASLERFMAGDVRVLTNVFCLTEGTDLPPCSVVVWARGVGTEAMWIQGGGRALRRSEGTGKRRAAIVDLRGSFHRFGGLARERQWSLDGEPVRHVEPLPPCRQCPACLAWVEVARCPDCGTACADGRRPARVVRKELHEQTAAREAARVARQDALARSGPDWDLFVSLVERQAAKGKAHTAGFLFMRQRGRAPRWRVEHALEALAARQGAA
jgi:superfamily II DNA or RNA helicase